MFRPSVTLFTGKQTSFYGLWYQIVHQCSTHNLTWKASIVSDEMFRPSVTLCTGKHYGQIEWDNLCICKCWHNQLHTLEGTFCLRCESVVCSDIQSCHPKESKIVSMDMSHMWERGVFGHSRESKLVSMDMSHMWERGVFGHSMTPSNMQLHMDVLCWIHSTLRSNLHTVQVKCPEWILSYRKVNLTETG